MEEVTIYKSYGEYKATLDAELKTNVESFMRIGYLLKVARDTEILSESGYKNVAEFAQAEYGLTKDIVSRYIAINDRYSENGYSERLKTEFEGYGVAKLSEMLTLPDSIIAEIEPTLTRKEIQDIKKEIAEEDAITPMEVLMEEKEVTELSFTQQCWKECLKNDAARAEKLIKAADIDEAFDILAPTGMQILWARLPGIGKIMISVKGTKEQITFTNSRDGSKEEQTAAEAFEDIKLVLANYEPPKVESKVIENVTESAEVLGMNPPEEAPEEVKEEPSEEQTEEPEELTEAAGVEEEQTEEATEEPKEESDEEPEEEPEKAAGEEEIEDSFSKLSDVDKIWHNVNTELSILNTKVKGKFTKSSYATVGVIKTYLEKIMEMEQ